MPESQRVKLIRKHTRLNQQEFAERIGTVQSKISMIEKGQQTLSLEQAGMIVELFDVKAEWIMGKIGNDNEIIFNTKSTIVQEPQVNYELQSKYMKMLEENYELQKKLNREQETEIEKLKERQGVRP
jgi:transcriptional regulator with XRE-family HTH domain